MRKHTFQFYTLLKIVAYEVNLAFNEMFYFVSNCSQLLVDIY